MMWSTERIQDRDGYWVRIMHGFDVAEQLGPFPTEDDAWQAEFQARMRIRLAHGPSAFEG